LARRIQPAVGFVDLVLPPDTMAQLKAEASVELKKLFA